MKAKCQTLKQNWGVAAIIYHDLTRNMNLGTGLLVKFYQQISLFLISRSRLILFFFLYSLKKNG